MKPTKCNLVYQTIPKKLVKVDKLQTIEDCRNNPRALWRTVNSILNAPAQQSTATFTANYFAQFFQSKVNKIRDSTATCPPPDIQYRSVPSLNSFAPVTESEIRHMLSNCPTKSSTLDPTDSYVAHKTATPPVRPNYLPFM